MKPSAAILILAPVAFCCGCPPQQPSLIDRLRDARPAVRIEAIVEAADRREAAALPHLIDRLSDEDAAVRLYAITALEKMTGKTMDYRHYAPLGDRKAAVERWRQWLRAGGAPRK